MGHRVDGAFKMKPGQRDAGIEACWDLGVKVCPDTADGDNILFDVDSDDETKLREKLTAINVAAINDQRAVEIDPLAQSQLDALAK